VDSKSVDNPLQNKHFLEAKFKNYSDRKKSGWKEVEVKELP